MWSTWCPLRFRIFWCKVNVKILKDPGFLGIFQCLTLGSELEVTGIGVWVQDSGYFCPTDLGRDSFEHQMRVVDPRGETPNQKTEDQRRRFEVGVSWERHQGMCKRKLWVFTPSSTRDGGRKEDMGAMADLPHMLKSLDQDDVKVLALSIIPQSAVAAMFWMWMD